MLRRIARDGFPPSFDPPLPSRRKKSSKAKPEVYPKLLEKVVEFL